ncbi:DegT/DnrJ/EryC1/StrS family aminotransferase [Streptomyces sp. NBC_00079]|uniref:DegT/DnrJ/EryC1/StrS family aminotransferase n=1 Tax=Streptomyces sp. NBC_00079 TaxID=2975644 RepID=UPI00324F8CA9
MRTIETARADRDLSVNGGRPAIPRPDQPPETDEALAEECAKLVRDGHAFQWYGGERQRAFEDAFAQLVGARHAVHSASGTAALHLALHACGVRPGSVVAVPTLGFYSVLNAVLAMGAVPFLVPVRPVDLVLDVDRACEEIPCGATLVAVHHLGRAVDVAEIRARRPDLVVIEDAADAQATRVHGKPVGREGLAACWSFTTTHNVVNTIVPSGMVTTDSEETAVRIRRLMHYGKDFRRYTPGTPLNPLPTELGFNYMSHELAAAIGLHSVRTAAECWETRRANGAALEEGLADLGLRTFPTAPDVEQNYYDVVFAPDDSWGANTGWVLDALVAEGCPAWSYHSLFALAWVRQELERRGAWTSRENELARTEDPTLGHLLGIRPPTLAAQVPHHVAAVRKVFTG